MPKLLADDREFEISSAAWEAWKDAAEPFELPDDVLRRVLGLKIKAVAEGEQSEPVPSARLRAGKSRSRRAEKRSRVASDLLLPESEYELPILEALSATGGRRPTREVVEEVGRVLDGRLTEVDHEAIRDGGQPRWQNRVQFARLRLVKGGFMKADSPRGVWEISPAGEARLKATAK